VLVIKSESYVRAGHSVRRAAGNVCVHPTTIPNSSASPRQTDVGGAPVKRSSRLRRKLG
jgi:hypothetical protein